MGNAFGREALAVQRRILRKRGRESIKRNWKDRYIEKGVTIKEVQERKGMTGKPLRKLCLIY